MWDTYQSLYGAKLPVDVWNIHNFILKERLGDYGAGIPPGLAAETGMLYDSDLTHVDMGLFDSQIRAFRQWMKDRGEQNKPLYVTEYGVLYWHEGLDDPQIVQEFMLSTFDYFLNTRDCALGYAADGCRLVQRWAWYSLDDNGTLFGFNTHAAWFDPATRQITAAGAKVRGWSLAHMTETAE